MSRPISIFVDLIDAAEPRLGVVESKRGGGLADGGYLGAFDLNEGRQAGPGVEIEDRGIDEQTAKAEKADLQARPISCRRRYTDLPPQARLQRSPPDHRVRRPGRQPLDREPDRLVNPQVHPHQPPPPHHRDPGRPARHHSR
jgi:hypothetical protein